MQIFVEILLVLAAARGLGELARRQGLPSSAGEILAGMGLAALIVPLSGSIPFLASLAASPALEAVANVGIFFLVLMAGIEMEPSEIAKTSGTASAVALGGVLVPLAGGGLLVWFALPEGEDRAVLALLAGVAMAISAIPASVRVLTDLKLLHTRLGETIVAAALFDDVIGLFLLALLLAIIETGGPPGLLPLALLLLKVAGFFGATVLIGWHIYPKVSRGMKALQATAMEFTALTFVALAYGLLAELLDMHWILGAFVAGLYFERSRVGAPAYREIKLVCSTVTNGFLAPLFFAYIGLQVDLRAVTEIPLFLLALIAVALAGKLIGAGLPAYWAGLGARDAAAVGVGMSARGAVELIVLSIAYESGVFGAGPNDDGLAGYLFSALVLMGIVTTMIVPLALQWLLRDQSSGPVRPDEGPPP